MINTQFFTAATSGLAALASWLEASDIKYTRNTSDFSLQVPAKDGTVFEFVIGYPTDRSNTIVFNFEVMSQKNRREFGYKVFTDAIAKIGHQIRNIFPREPTSKRMSIQDNFDSVVFRHHVLRNAVNPSPQQMAAYGNSVKIAVRRFFGVNMCLCQKSGYRREDLTQYALVWAVNFHSDFRIIPINGSNVDLDNLKLLNNYIHQKFEDLRIRMVKKLASFFVDGVEALYESLADNSFHTNGLLAIENGELSDSVSDKKDRRGRKSKKAVLDQEPPDIAVMDRKKNNSQKLKRLLATAPHDFMVEQLQITVWTPEKKSDVGIRRLAKQLLDQHTMQCSKCSNLEPRKEETVSVDPGSLEESFIYAL